MENESWSRKVAALTLDALVDHGLLRRENFDAAVDIAAEEIQIRLAMADYPPSMSNQVQDYLDVIVAAEALGADSP